MKEGVPVISDAENVKITPFLKWAGGKRWLVRDYSHLLPKKFNRYIEPFLGSGAVYFHVRPDNALLGDTNKELIETYLGVKADYRKVEALLRKHQREHCKEYYYQMRKAIPRTLATKAARLIYLNRTCWNGLYRVNLNGKYNVPIGTKSSIYREDDNFEAAANLLKKAEIKCCDFAALINRAREGDFLFVDPPYTVSHNQNAFIKYNEKLFSWKDQERLVTALKEAKQRGVMILATNAYHSSVIKLYRSDFDQQKAGRLSIISCINESRMNYSELVVTANLP